jgi:endonuclease/exonuclease/phosphatase family metal-dependent hydrolase
VKRRDFLRCVIWITTAVCLIFLGAERGAYAESDQLTVKVMTRNMDAGTDLQYVFGAATTEQFVQGVVQTIAEVDASRIPDRAIQLASEIGAAQPDLIALQEVTTWDINDASGVRSYDQLALLMDALEAAQLHYRVAVLQPLTDLPVDIPDVLSVHFMDSNAILVRSDLPPGHLMVIGTETHLYDNFLTFELPGDMSVTALNGWLAVDVKIRGARFKFANTHMLTAIPGDLFEATAQIQLAQAGELLEGLGATDLPVILAGDFNSDAEVPQNFPDQTPTAATISSLGYLDVWHALFPDEHGYTWPLFLEDQAPPDFNLPTEPFERIDLIYSYGPTPLSIERTGMEMGPAGVYASDHAGVAADFSLENHRPDVPQGNAPPRSTEKLRPLKSKMRK